MRGKKIILHLLDIKHHVGNGLLSVLLTVVEENLLAAHYNILQQPQHHNETTRSHANIKTQNNATPLMFIPSFPIQISLCCFLQGETASPPTVFLSEGNKREHYSYTLK